MTALTTQHLFTVDVEDYFQVNAFEGTVDRSRWDSYPTRVEQNVDIILELLDRRKAHGTFFTLGWIAQRCPQVVRRIAQAGHEVASHGWWHRRVTELSRDEFREDLRTSRTILEDVSGQPVYGYRAPSFSIRPGMEWAFDILLEEGYRYDSSLFPIRRPDYGYPNCDPSPHLVRRSAGTLLELPLATYSVLGMRLPAAGGGYFRQFPFLLFQRTFQRLDGGNVPGMFYIHPWEVDPGQPRLPVSWLAQLRHYTGLARTLPRLERLLSEFKFTSVTRRFGVDSTLEPDLQWSRALTS
jgi:polysaccharide deacetylase family protein (PEP-CTERM system associated)